MSSSRPLAAKSSPFRARLPGGRRLLRHPPNPLSSAVGGESPVARPQPNRVTEAEPQ